MKRLNKIVSKLGKDSDDVANTLYEYLPVMVESHLRKWGTNYKGLNERQARKQIYNKYDPTTELVDIENWIRRKLEPKEEEVIVECFNEAVLMELYGR